MLKVHYQYKLGTTIIQGTGFCIESTEKKASILHDDGSWIVLDDNKMTILETYPEHTGMKFGFDNLSFINISADSLNQLTTSHDIQKIDVVANQEFTVSCDGVGERSKAFKADHVSDIVFQTDQVQIQPQAFTPERNPRIGSLQRKIALLKQEHELAMIEFRAQQSESRRRQIDIAGTSELFAKESMQRKIKELKSLAEPAYPTQQIAQLEADIRELEITDQQRNAEKRKNMELTYLETIPEETVFTGVVQYVKIFSG